MKWTESQYKAINNDGKNLLVSAGAGCGKTAILTNRIIRLMLENKIDINKFLVVTFTNAAANGMKEKIRKLLYEKLKEEKSDKKFLFEQISNLESANISTLHSLCINIIREYYHIVEIDPSFQIITDTNVDMLMDEAFEKLFNDRYENNDEQFIQTSLNYSFSRTNEDYFKEQLKSIYTFIYNRPSPFKWLHEKVEFFNQNEEELKESLAFKIIKEEAYDGIELSFNLLNEALEKAKFYKANEKLIDLLNEEVNNIKLLKRDFDNNSNKVFSLKMGDIFRARIVGTNKLDPQIKNEITQKRNLAKDTIKNIINNLYAFSIEDMLKINNNLYPQMQTIEKALIDFDYYYKEIKKEKGVLEFNDIEHLCLEILNNENARKEIVNKFDFVFVDEYQDTNLVQEAIITKIIKENNLFTVGDVKQSIYRFRQAEPEVFINRLERYEKENDINEIIYMNTNFRTNKNIISGINELFSKIMSKDIGKIDYIENEKLIPGRNEEIESKIELHFLKENENDEDYFDKPLTNDEKEYTYLAMLINNLIKQDIYDSELKKFRKTKFSDICILARSANTKIKPLKEIFNKYSIPVNSEKETEYFKTHEISIIKDFLNIINNFKDDLSLLGIMRGPIFNFSTEELLEIKLYSKEKYYYKCVENFTKEENDNIELKNKVINMINIINEYNSKSLYMSVSDLIEDIYEKTSFTEYVKALPFGNIRENNLKALITKAKEYENFSNEGLYGFIKFMDYAKERNESGIALNENSDNSVKFTTIHASKGLEFPIVILMDTSKTFNERDLKENIVLNKDLGLCPSLIDLDNKIKINSISKISANELEKQELKSEEMRLLYVALTRAKEKLIITSKAKIEDILEKIPKEITRVDIKNSKTYLDWIVKAILYNNHFNTKENIVFEDKNFIIYNNDINSLLTDTNNNEDKTIKNEKFTNEDFSKLIIQNLNYKYKNIIDTKIPRKAGVSSLKNTELLEVGNNVITIKEEPDFLKEETEISAAQKGTIIHFIFETIDINKLKEDSNLRDNIDNQINELIEKEILSKKEYESIDIEYVYKFFESEIGKQLLNSKKIYRELPFNLAIPAKDISDKWVESDEDVLVQGIIDLTFEDENGNMILVDYKTNYFKTDKEKETLIKEYKLQINYYKKAITTLMNKKVSHSYLYFLSKNIITEV